MRAKHVSLWLKIAGAVAIAAGFALNGIFGWGYSGWDIVTVGIAIAALGAPVDLSMVLSNLPGSKKVSGSGPAPGPNAG